MNAFKARCIALRKADYTLTEIAHITGRPKTSVFFHTRDIPLSEKKQKEIRASYQRRARRLAYVRKGKSVRPFTPFSLWNSQYVSLVAHLLFDGEIQKNGCIYNNRNKTLIHKVERCMRDMYVYAPKWYLNPETGVYRIAYYNVALSTFLKKQSKYLLKDILELSPALQKIFLRAFFDDEGCMDYRPRVRIRRVRGYQKKKSILKLIQKLLNHFSIHSEIKDPNEIVIKGKENLIRFQKIINFSQGVCINGGRTNSVWKESLEKRTMLNKAIASFKS